MLVEPSGGQHENVIYKPKAVGFLSASASACSSALLSLPLVVVGLAGQRVGRITH